MCLLPLILILLLLAKRLAVKSISDMTYLINKTFAVKFVTFASCNNKFNFEWDHDQLITISFRTRFIKLLSLVKDWKSGNVAKFHEICHFPSIVN